MPAPKVAGIRFLRKQYLKALIVTDVTMRTRNPSADQVQTHEDF
jgi:hypothetical protein